MKKLIFVLCLFISSLSVAQTFEVVVKKITDGDTIQITKESMENLKKYLGITKKTEPKIRLSVIDTCETPWPLNKRKKEKIKEQAELLNISEAEVKEFGKKAKNIMKNLIQPGDVLIFEPEKRVLDRYNRFLGYVYKKETQINKYMAEQGLVMLYKDTTLVYYQAIKKMIEAAQQEKKGIWKNYKGEKE